MEVVENLDDIINHHSINILEKLFFNSNEKNEYINYFNSLDINFLINTFINNNAMKKYLPASLILYNKFLLDSLKINIYDIQNDNISHYIKLYFLTLLKLVNELTTENSNVNYYNTNAKKCYFSEAVSTCWTDYDRLKFKADLIELKNDLNEYEVKLFNLKKDYFKSDGAGKNLLYRFNKKFESVDCE